MHSHSFCTKSLHALNLALVESEAHLPVARVFLRLGGGLMEKAESLLKRLPMLDVVQLREQWFLHFYKEASKTMSAKFMRLAIAYKVQELENNAVARCEAIRKKSAEYRHTNNDLGTGRSLFLRPGTRLLREYKGKVHEVLAVENGRFVYEGKVCDSLSEVSRKITGSPRPGTVFFGISGKPWRGFDG